MTIREYHKAKGIALREVYRMIERGELTVVEVTTEFIRNRKIKHVVEK